MQSSMKPKPHLREELDCILMALSFLVVLTLASYEPTLNAQTHRPSCVAMYHKCVALFSTNWCVDIYAYMRICIYTHTYAHTCCSEPISTAAGCQEQHPHRLGDRGSTAQPQMLKRTEAVTQTRVHSSEM